LGLNSRWCTKEAARPAAPLGEAVVQAVVFADEGDALLAALDAAWKKIEFLGCDGLMLTLV
jgi:hypothetical protein